jgi:hypothetical protein
MACFLDPDLNPSNVKANLTPARIARVGSSGPRVTPNLVFTLFLAICYLAAATIRFINRHKTTRPPLWLTIAVVTVCVFSCCWCIGHIFLVRWWVGSTGWMETTSRPGKPSGNPENSVEGLGQLLPVATMIWLFVTALDVHRQQPRSVPKDMAGQP